MSPLAEKKNFEKAIKEADVPAKKRAFRNGLPYAILEDGQVVLVYPDQHREVATAERLNALTR